MDRSIGRLTGRVDSISAQPAQFLPILEHNVNGVSVFHTFEYDEIFRELHASIFVDYKRSGYELLLRKKGQETLIVISGLTSTSRRKK